MSDYLLLFTASLLVAYLILILTYLVGWIMIKPFKPKDHPNQQVTFSILVPARNEENTIATCLSDLVNQVYDTHKFEVIVLDDYSSDETANKVRDFIMASGFQVKLIQMSTITGVGKYKKAAITYGVEQALGDYIILTDADCTRGNKWLMTINSFIDQTQAKMIYAPVAFKANNWFEKLQSLEFAGLMGIGGSAIQLRNPNMCSAANLIFQKQVFEKVGGYVGNDGLASGDDEFLLHKVFKYDSKGVHFLKHIDALVETSPNASLQQLTDQRRRWVSKSTKYENRYITLILVMAYLFNLLVFVELFLNPLQGVVMLLLKTITEGIFLYLVLRFLNRAKLLLLLPSAEIFHILYVIVIGIWANAGTYRWKGRELK